MWIETYLELIEFFMLFLWVLNSFIAGLLLLSLGIVARLCYTQARPEGGNRG